MVSSTHVMTGSAPIMCVRLVLPLSPNPMYWFRLYGTEEYTCIIQFCVKLTPTDFGSPLRQPQSLKSIICISFLTVQDSCSWSSRAAQLSKSQSLAEPTLLLLGHLNGTSVPNPGCRRMSTGSERWGTVSHVQLDTIKTS